MLLFLHEKAPFRVSSNRHPERSFYNKQRILQSVPLFRHKPLSHQNCARQYKQDRPEGWITAVAGLPLAELFTAIATAAFL